MSIYQAGETKTSYLQVLRHVGNVPIFPGDYSTPQIRVLHFDSSLIEDVASTSMTQLDDNLWRFDFNISASPFFGDYLIEYTLTIDGIDIESSETFKVEQPPDIVEQGQGSCQVDGTVKDSGTLQPISGVDVYVFTSSDLVNAIAHDVTDTNGAYTVFLNSGSYKIRFHRVGFIDETHDLVVNSDCTHDVMGD